MKKATSALRITPLSLICLLAIAVFAGIFSTGFTGPSSAAGDAPGEDTAHYTAQQTQESKAAFLEAYKVFMHPRCMNCHPAADAPLQGDDSHIHLQNVTRGKDGKGVYAMKCKNCHQDANLAGKGMPPGNPDWSMPPADRKMVFQGKSARELALHFKDNRFTGFKSLRADMDKHLHTSLVETAWNDQDGHSKPPLSHEEFVAKVREWIDKGAAVPDN